MVQDPHRYTKKDMKTLEQMSEKSTVLRNFLKKLDYDPKKFKDFLEDHGLKKDVKYLFETPLKEIPLLINKGEINGYLKFRLTVGK